MVSSVKLCADEAPMFDHRTDQAWKKKLKAIRSYKTVYQDFNSKSF